MTNLDPLTPALAESNGFNRLVEDAWERNPQEEQRALEALQRDDWTVTELVKSYIDARLKSLQRLAEIRGETRKLAEVTIDGIVEALRGTSDLDEQIKTIVHGLDWTVLRRLMLSGRLPYHYLRRAIQCCTSPEVSAIDIDLALSRHTNFLRNQFGTAKAEDLKKYILTLDDFVKLVESESASEDHCVRFYRSRPPKMGFEMFDKSRAQEVRLCADTDIYKEHFYDKFTSLRGVNWTGMVVAGPAAYLVLGERYSALPMNWPDHLPVEVYLFGMNADQASQKLEHIHSTIQAETSMEVRIDRTLVQTTFTIHSNGFVHHRYSVRHRTYASELEILDSFAVDPAAMAFNGQDLLFSGRAARALETGFTTFTTNLVYGASTSLEDHENLINLILFADWGMGLRFLPTQLASLSQEIVHTSLGSSKYLGVKTGREFMERLETMISKWALKHYALQEVSEEFVEWLESGRVGINPAAGYMHAIIEDLLYSDVTRNSGLSLVGSSGLFSLQRLMWFHKLWADEILVVNDILNKLMGSRQSQFSQDIFQRFLCPAIEKRLGITGTSRSDYTGYLTRRIRCSISCTSMDELRRWQIVLPLVIPRHLEIYIDHMWNSRVHTSHIAAQGNVLIPVQDSTNNYRGVLGNIPETDLEGGNLRYWTLGTRKVWSGQDQVRDVLSESIQCLVDYSQKIACLNYPSGQSLANEYSAASYKMKETILLNFRRHLVASHSLEKALSMSRAAKDVVGLEAEEARMVRSWALTDHESFQVHEENPLRGPREILGDILRDSDNSLKSHDILAGSFQWTSYNEDEMEWSK